MNHREGQAFSLRNLNILPVTIAHGTIQPIVQRQNRRPQIDASCDQCYPHRLAIHNGTKAQNRLEDCL